MKPERAVVVGKYQFEYEAQLARAQLEGEGIAASIVADNAGGMIPSLSLLFPLRLLVREEDAELARTVLAEAGE